MSRHLIDTVALDPGITLRDIFLLLDIDPLLQEVFARDWAKEFVVEVMGGNSKNVPAIKYGPESIEYLELYQLWN